MGSQRVGHDWATFTFTFTFIGGASGKEPTCQCRLDIRDADWTPPSGRFPCRRGWQSTPVFLLGEYHGQRSLASYSPWGRRVGHDWSSLAWRTYLWNGNRMADIESRLVTAKEAGVEECVEREVGASRCQLLYIAWINSKVLLHSTENYIQYPVINHNGKEYIKKECVYTYNWNTLLYTEISTTL